MKTWHWPQKATQTNLNLTGATQHKDPVTSEPKKMDGPPNTDVRNVPGVDAILSHHWKNQVRLDAKKKPKRKQVSQPFSHRLEQFGHFNVGKAQGTECWSRRFTPTRTASIWDRQDLQKSHTTVFIWKKSLFAMFCLISTGFQQEWDYSNRQQQSGKIVFQYQKTPTQ